MTIATITSREFNQNTARAKKMANSGPVFITTRSKPSHVLLCIEDFRCLTGRTRTLAESLAMPGHGFHGATRESCRPCSEHRRAQANIVAHVQSAPMLVMTSTAVTIRAGSGDTSMIVRRISMLLLTGIALLSTSLPLADTSPSGRYLYADTPGADGITILDFNKAHSPPCAFTNFATCPLPSRQNRMKVAIEAGEKYDKGK